jgi:hypothetical protein
MMEAILNGHLLCSTLSTNKWQPEDGEDAKPLFIRHHLAAVEACIHGTRMDRRLLRWARIDRTDFQEWCERQGVPLPEFWFPPGWKLDYEWPRDYEEKKDEEEESGSAAETLRPNARYRITCQEIATVLWKERPDRTIADMVKDPQVRRLGGAARFGEEAVRRWLSAVAPLEVKAKRGRPPKKKGGEDDQGPA